jgi:uncharacterized protein (TIGR03118 family)
MRIAFVLICVLASTVARARAPTFNETDLVSDIPGRAAHTDPNLMNPWGLVANPTGPWWVSDNGAGVATLYDQNGVGFPQPTPLVVTLEGPASPTGIVFNGGAGFVIHDHAKNSGVARFLFATEDGFIEGWSPGVPPPQLSRQAFIAVNNSTKGCRLGEQNCGSVYKGLAIATNEKGETHLYATDFRNARVDVFDSNFAPDDRHRAFVDNDIPEGFAPFGIAHLKGHLFVTYAMQDDTRHDDVKGAGNGFVDEFDLEGRLLRRVASRGVLNSPWGLAFAPEAWGRFEGDLLIGNFGDGGINVFRPRRLGEFGFVDALRDEDGQPIVIDGLWALVFGPGNDVAGPRDALFFTAGINGEADGLFGKITRVVENEREDEHEHEHEHEDD